MSCFTDRRMNPPDQIRNIRPGQTINFPANGHYVAMKITSTASASLEAPAERQREYCLEVIKLWDADRAANTGISTLGTVGDVRMDNEGTINEGTRSFAKVRLQLNSGGGR